MPNNNEIGNSLRDRLEKIQKDNNVQPQDSVTEAQNIYDAVDEKEENMPNYRELIKSDAESLTDEEFANTRKAAFDSVKDDLKGRINGDDEEPAEEKPIKKKSALELYEEKNPIITQVEEKEPEEDPNAVKDVGTDLMDSLKDIEKDSAVKSRILYEEQKKYEEAKFVNTNTPQELTDKVNSDNVDDIISSIEESNSRKDMDIEEDEEENLEVLLEKIESQKVYTTYKSTEEYVGPADFTVTDNEDYQDTVEEILGDNGFTVIKKNTKDKNALLERFVNSGNEVTVPLVNSGIYVTFTGASTSEIISMNQISGNDSAEITLNKLNIMNNHITNSSIGKMRLSQLIKVISYYDIETLNFAFYAATHPDMSEITRSCGRCGQDYYIKQKTRDLLINPEDYSDEAKDIRENVTTYEILLDRSRLNKTIKKVCSGGQLIVEFKHPSIEAYISTARNLMPETEQKYPQLIDMAYAIDKLYLRDSGKNYVEYNDPNSIIDIIGKIKNPKTKYELLDMLEEVRPCAIPSYGYSDTMCPHCGNKDRSEPFSMENLLFTVAQQEDEMETLRWAAKLQSKRKSKKKSKTTTN